jgi:hypothetical protein
MSAKLVLTFVDRGFHVISMTDPYGRILDLLDRSRYTQPYIYLTSTEGKETLA